MYLSQNLKHLRKTRAKLSQAGLAEKLGISRAALSSYEEGRAEPKLRNLNVIANFFSVSVDQLMNVPLAEKSVQDASNEQAEAKRVSGSEMRILTVPVDDNGEETVAFVPERAKAGYSTGYADPDYVGSLPQYRMPFLPKHKTYRAFELDGDSMLPLESGTIVICEYLADWTEVRDGELCVVVSQNEGIVFKQVYNRVRQHGELLLKSTNTLYEPYGLPVSEVGEVWRFVAYIGRSFPQEESSSVDSLKTALSRLENAFYDLQKKQQATD